MARFAKPAFLATLAVALVVFPSLGSAGEDAPPTLAPMLARISPSVVNIMVPSAVESERERSFGSLRAGESPNAPNGPFVTPTLNVGSGVIFDSRRGYVLTNHHLIAEASDIMVTLSDGRQVKAALVGADPETDVAVLKIEPKALTAIPIGDSDRLRVGNYVAAIGNPFGIGQTATFGIVGGLGRSFLNRAGYETFIQTDAAINPGNSGGALVDMRGRLVGINEAIIGPIGAVPGIGLAIPINVAMPVAAELIAHGEVRRGTLGVDAQELPLAVAEVMGMAVRGGAVVLRVKPSSAAAKAGIEVGDVIVELNGKEMRNASSLSRIMSEVALLEPGTPLRVTFLRRGARETVVARLESKPATRKSPLPVPAPELVGAAFGPIPRGSPFYGKADGVYVARVHPGSAAARAGLQARDVIVSADRFLVTAPNELLGIALYARDGLLLGVRRKDAALFLVLRP